MAFMDKGQQGEELDPKKLVSDIIEQRKASLRYYNNNFYGEFGEIYRNIHARTKPFRRWNREKNEWENDDTRTNVCVPDHFDMLRRGTARLTRNPPNLRIRGGPDTAEGQFNRDKTGAFLMYQWDRAESQIAFKKAVSVGYGLGWAVSKSYYDEIPIVRRLRRLAKNLAPADFDNLANSEDLEIAQTVQVLGDRLKDPTPFTDQEKAMLIERLGNEVRLEISAMKYKGPVLTTPFVGDVYTEPGFPSLMESGYVIENSLRDEDYFKYWIQAKSIDPRTGQEKPVFDEAAVEKAWDKAGSRQYIDEQEMTLRRQLREEIQVADPITAGKPIRAPRKRAMIDERHIIVDGHLCVDFVCEESEYLGRLWYPWETYGRYVYNELVLIPDWLGGIGSSTLRVTRFLHMLRNTRLNQTSDFINNKLLPFLKVRSGADITEYDLVRTGFARLLELENLADVEFMQDQTFPAEAWQDQAQLQQMMQQADPATISFAPGTSDVAQPGKFATTANLAAKQADSITADLLDNLGQYIRGIVELHLWMNQQAMDEPETIEKTYLDRAGLDKKKLDEYGMSIRTQGAQAREVVLDPMDIQELYEALPEQGSTLASDDEFRIDGLQKFYLVGQGHPDIVNLRAVITALARATPGVNAEDVILPPPPPAPPVPPVKMNISLSVKWEQLPADVQAAILQHEGLPVTMTNIEGIAKGVKTVSDAADAASNLEAPIEHNAPMPSKPVANGQKAGK